MFRNQNFATCNNGPGLGPTSTKFGDTKTTPTRALPRFSNGKASFVRADTLWQLGHKAEALQEFQAIFDNTYQKDIPQYVCKLLFENDSKLCNFSDLIFWCSTAAYAGISNDLILEILIKHVGEQLENIYEDLDGYRNFLHSNLSALRKEVSNLRKDVQFMSWKRKSRKSFPRRELQKRNEGVQKISYTDDLRSLYNPHYLSAANALYNDVMRNAMLWNLGYYDFNKYLNLKRQDADNGYEAKCKRKILNLTKAICKAKSMRKKCKKELGLCLKKMFSHRQTDILDSEFVNLKKVSTNLYKKLVFLRDNIGLSSKSDGSEIRSQIEYRNTKSEVEVAIDNFCTSNEDILRRLLNRSCIDKTMLLKKSMEEFCKDHDVVLKRLIDLSTKFRERDVASDDSVSRQSMEENSNMISNLYTRLDVKEDSNSRKNIKALTDVTTDVALDNSTSQQSIAESSNIISDPYIRLDLKEDSNSQNNITALTDITNRYSTIEGLNNVIPYHNMEIKPSINDSSSENIEMSNKNTIVTANTDYRDEIDSFTSLEMFCNDSVDMTEFFTSETSNYGKVGRKIDCMELLIERACMFDAMKDFDITNDLDVLDSIFDKMGFDEGISDSPFYECCEGESSDYPEYNSSSQEETLSSFKNCYSMMTINSTNDVDKGYSSEDTVYHGKGDNINKTSLASLELKYYSSSPFSLVDDNNIWFNYVASITEKYNTKNYLLQYLKHKSDVSVKFNINLLTNFKNFANIIVNCNLGEDFFHKMLAVYSVELTHCDKYSLMPVHSSSRFFNCNEDLSMLSRSLDTMSCVKDIISRWPVFQSRLLESQYMCFFLFNIRLHNCKSYNCRFPRRDSELFLRNFIMVNAPFLSNHFERQMNE